jgi:hypothetical protein
VSAPGIVKVSSLNRKSMGLILSFVTGEQYGRWVRRPLGKAASAGRYAN